MKKLMIVAAVVCAATFSQAAQFNWAFENDDDMGSYSVANNATYYIVSGDTGVGSTLATILSSQGTDAFTAAIADMSYQTGTLTSGKASGTVSGVTEDYAAIFILNDGLVADANFAYIEYDVSGNVFTPPSSAATKEFYASDWGDPDYSSAWGSGAVAAAPEPTSGLLLLLGMAGLALRRRRA